MQYRKSLITALSLAIVAAAGIRVNAQAHVVENQTNFVYVDATTGSDSNSGTLSSPFKTIQAAINKANTYNRASVGTKVIVNPGIYREYVVIGNNNATAATLTVEAARTGTAIIAGSDVLTGWTQQSPTIYSVNWAANPRTCTIPSSWPTDFAPIGRRTEMIIVDGVPLTQVMSYSDLVPGTFYLDGTTSTMFVSPSSSTNMATAVVEAAKRPQTLTVSGRSNVVLRGLVFRHAANCMNVTSAAVNSSNNILVDGIQATWNNWIGFGVFGSTNITVQNSVANYNGGLGFSATKDQTTLFNFNESDYNNWRGAQAAYYDWAMGGTKFFQMRSTTVLNHFAYNNLAEGLWFDTDNKGILIDNATLSGNVQAGLQIERNEGPITLQNSYLCYSGQGANVLTSANVTIKNNTFYNNGGTNKFQGDIYIAGTAGGIVINDWQTHQAYDLFTTGMVLSGNTFQDSSTNQFVFGTYLGGTDWTSFSTTLNASNNKWYNSATTNAFRIPNGKTVNLAAWQSAVSSDYSSAWALPSTSPVAACAAPTASFADFSVVVDNRSYTMSSGVAVANVNVRSFGFGPVSLRVSGLPSGVGASFSQQSLVSGTSAITFTSSSAAVAQTVPITLWATSGSRVHSVTFYVQVRPFATTQTTPTITWPTPGTITYGTPLSATQLAASMSVAGSCSYAPVAGTVLAPGTKTLTATCVPADTIAYKTPAPATVSLNVRKAQLTITASSATVNHGDAVPIITPSFSGFVNGDSIATLTTVPTCTTSYTPANAAGSTATTDCSGAISSNYAMSYIAGTVTVSSTKSSQTINFTPPATPVSYGASAIPLVASSTSGLPITFTGTPGVCVASGNTVSMVGAGACGVTASQAGNANYAAAQSITRSIIVDGAALVITASSATVNYGDPVPIITASFSGFVNGDNAASLTTAPTCTTSYTPTSTVGSTAPTNCSGAASGNYSIRYVPGTLSVSATKPLQTITFPQPTTPVNYGASAIPLVASATSGLPVTFTGTPGVCAVSGNTVNMVGAGTCSVTAIQSGSVNYAAAQSVTRSITVSPATLVITASSATVNYGDPVPIIAASFSGFVNGDNSASLTTAPTCTTSYTPTSTVGSTAPTNCSGAASGNYSIRYVPGTLSVSVSKPQQTITFVQPATPVTYGASAIPLVASSTSGLPVSFTVTAGACAVSGNSINLVGAGACSITAIQDGNVNYAAAQSVTRSITVSPATLVITASSATVNYGDPVPIITPSFSGFVNGDNSGSLATAPTCTTSYTPTSTVGSTTPTNCSGAASGNYSIRYVPGTLSVSVTKSPQSIAFPEPATPLTYGAPSFLLSAASSSGLPVSFNGTPGVCFVNGNTLSIVGAGACTVTASQPGNTNYAAAPTVSQAIAVNPAALVITASSATVSYGDAVPTITASFGGFVNSDTAASLLTAPSCSTAYTPKSSPGSSPATNCMGAVSANYSIRYVAGTVTIDNNSKTSPGNTSKPVFSLAAGTYTSAQVVTISFATPGAAIYYTTDGTTPTTNSPQYSGPITVSASETIQAIAVVSGSPSSVASASYTIATAQADSDFSVAASLASLSLKAGESGNATIAVTPTNGFHSAVSFVCLGLPAGTTCSFSPSSVTPAGGATSTTLTLTTSKTMADLGPGSHTRFPTAVLSVTLCLVGWKRRRIQVLLLLVLSVLGMAVLSGCGATSYSIGSAAAKQTTALITVSGVAGTVQHDATISLTVNGVGQ